MIEKTGVSQIVILVVSFGIRNHKMPGPCLDFMKTPRMDSFSIDRIRLDKLSCDLSFLHSLAHDSENTS